MPATHGIDFHAAYQDPNWDLVDDWQLLVVKFTEGVGFRDWWPSARDDFLRMRERARAGRHRWIGAYHVIRADFRVSDQVAHFLDAWEQVGGIQSGEFYQLDWEAWTYATPEISTSRTARRFVDEMNAALGGIRGITYSSDHLPDSPLDSDSRGEFIEWREENPSTDEAAGLWYANYNLGPGPTGGPAEVAKYDADIWQWSDRGTAAGFTNPVDLNEVQPKGFALLDRLTLRLAQPEPEPEPEIEDVSIKLVIRDVRPPYAVWISDGHTKSWVNSGLADQQLSMRLAESRDGTVPSPVDGFTYRLLTHGDDEVIASYGPIVGPAPDGFDAWGRLL